jgi:hypothetical protein
MKVLKVFSIGMYTLFQPSRPFRKRCSIVILLDGVHTLKYNTSNGMAAFKSSIPEAFF